MPESYKKTRLITPLNMPMDPLSYIGFINGATAQMVGIAGPFIYATGGSVSNANGVTYYGSTFGNLVKFSVGPGALVPIHVSNIVPKDFDVLGLIC